MKANKMWRDEDKTMVHEVERIRHVVEGVTKIRESLHTTFEKKTHMTNK